MSRSRNLLVFATLLSCLFSGSGFCELTDTQLWGALNLSHPLSENLMSKMQIAFRWQNDFSEDFHYHFQPGVMVQFPCEWTTTIHYRLAVRLETADDGSDFWRAEQQPMFDVVKRFSHRNFHIALRQRLHWKSVDDQLNYRIRGELSLPKRCLRNMQLQPLLSEELFYEMGGRFLENRNILGIRFFRTDSATFLVGIMTRHREQFFSNDFDAVLRIEWSEKR